jgi:hypothetical protein
MLHAAQPPKRESVTLVTVRFHQVTLGSLFKIGWICNLSIWIWLFPLFALGGNFKFNDELLTGFKGFVVSIVISLLLAFIGSIVIGVGGIIARFADRWLPLINLSYIDEPKD